jgi:hypothetical protein
MDYYLMKIMREKNIYVIAFMINDNHNKLNKILYNVKTVKNK